MVIWVIDRLRVGRIVRRVADRVTIGLRVAGIRIDLVTGKDDGAFIINEKVPTQRGRTGLTVRNKNTLNLLVPFGSHIDWLQSLVAPGTASLGVASVYGVIDLNFLG